MSKAAKFSNNVEISGNVDISGSINLDGTLTVDGSFSLYGYHIPDPSGEYNKVLTISGDGYSWETVQSSGSSGSADDISINAAGQTFFEIITEQPRAFTAETMTNGTLFNNTFNAIDIAWNFDNLIPKDENGQQQILNITEDLNQRVLPCITHIYFDISSSQQPNTTDSSKFVIAVDASDNYNVNTPTTTEQTWSIGDASLNSTLTYKTLTLSNANTNALRYTYTVRIWGENQSNGTEVNKLTYSDLEFLPSGIPATPTIHSITPSGTDTATLDISLNVPDIDKNNDNTVYNAAGDIQIKDVDVSCTETETLRSNKYNYGNTFELSETVTSQSQPDTNVQDISVNVSFTDTSFNLGSKYKIQAKCINALNDTGGAGGDGYTSYSTVFQMTDFIDIPTKEDLNTSYPFDSSFTYTNKTEDGGDDQFEINQAYSNIMIYDYSRSDTQSVTFNTTSNPSQIEVSDPDADKNDSFGYGKYIDDSLNLVTLECWLNDNGTDISLHTIHFHGWKHQDVSHTYHASNVDSIDFFKIPDTSYADVYSGTTRSKEGFRLKAYVNSKTILLTDMSNSNLIVPFDPYRDEHDYSTGYERNSNSNADTSYNNGYTFNYRYTHNNSHSTTNYSQEIKSKQLYIDYFPDYDYSSTSSNGTSDWTYTVEVTSVRYIMGIPYVYEFDLSINRDHYNAHSQYRYHRDDGQLARLNYLYASTSDKSTLGGALDDGIYTYLELPTNIDDFNDNGTYNGGLSWTSLSYVTQTKTVATNNTITGFQTSTAVYNLYYSHEWFTNNITLGTNKNHYFDYNSLNNYNTIFDNNIYELSDISELGSNMQDVHDSLELYEYAISSTEIKDHSILYIDGLFQLDSRKNNDQYYPYPDICDSFEWNGLISSYNNNTYTNKDKRYTTSGTQDNTDGYRWLVYKVDESTYSVEYVDTANSNSGEAGINLSYIMKTLFGATIENEFYNSLSVNNYDDDILVYIVGTAGGTHYLGEIKYGKNFNIQQKWYEENSIVNNSTLSGITGSGSSGALPGNSLQNSIRDNVKSEHSSYYNFITDINSHSPIAIYIDSDALSDHYFYFAIR